MRAKIADEVYFPHGEWKKIKAIFTENDEDDYAISNEAHRH